jgi:aryl-alcohol dehydrogenase-like predicted oxidoreductase
VEYTRLGSTGLQVSRVCLGMMSYGSSSWREWVLDIDASRPLVRSAVEAGVTFFDTADVYSLGVSEEVTGTLLSELFPRRDDYVLATKVFSTMSDRPNDRGLSRKHIMSSIDDSLRRLGTDHVDLYQIHRFDSETPIEETMEALHDVVKAGKARYIGASSMYAWQFAKAQYTADLGGCVIPWSPLARGRLARVPEQRSTTTRSGSDPIGDRMYNEADDAVVHAVADVAKARGLPLAQVALAWMLHQDAITAPIVGATKPGHVEDAVAAVDIELSDDEIAALEAPYVPHPVLGHQ